MRHINSICPGLISDTDFAALRKRLWLVIRLLRPGTLKDSDWSQYPLRRCSCVINIWGHDLAGRYVLQFDHVLYTCMISSITYYILHVRPCILFTLRLRCFLNIIWCWCRKSMRTCSRKGMIVYTKYAMFIKQSPARFTIAPKNDTKTRHRCMIYICGHLIQRCLLIE